MTIIWLPDKATWPANVADYLDENRLIFVDWYSQKKDDTPFSHAKHRAELLAARQFDEAIGGLSECLARHSLRGYHNTRLTPAEVSIIKKSGMSLPCPQLLAQRIDLLVNSGALSTTDAARLVEKNQADEEFRKNRIWFCFYEPKFAGQGGIEDLLRHWGGEALYNSHDRDERMGPVLRSIGIPCVIEAAVPIASLSSVNSLSLRVASAYANQHGARAEEHHFEGCAIHPIQRESVLRVIELSDPAFGALTDCDKWDNPLA